MSTKLTRLVNSMAKAERLRIVNVETNNHTKITVQHMNTGRQKKIVFSVSPRNEFILLKKVGGYLKTAARELGPQSHPPRK
jgi:hypothetical protein